jgi:hypothetical protein
MGLVRHDPGFSLVVFEDFLYFLYAEMHRGRGTGATDMLAPYLTDAVRATLRSDQLSAVTGIVVGSMTLDVVTFTPTLVTLEAVFESNYVERTKDGREQRWFARERLTLQRDLSAPSRTPDKARVLTCTNCGAPLQNMRGTTCSYCNVAIPPGKKDWGVVALQVLEREPKGPLLTSDVVEVGTDWPTVVDPQARTMLRKLAEKDPAFQWAAFEARVRTIYEEFAAGWVARDPLRCRPFLSDNLFQSQCYWIDLYKASHVINRNDGAAVAGVELASVTTDAHFDAITVRVYASGLDYHVTEDGKVLSGSTTVPRRYTEYWTLIRGAKKAGPSKGDRVCPQCGAPLKIGMSGNCEYCRAKVTGGEFDWVLSRIEQDEVYTG